jgi:hypothetical protein
MGVFFVVSRSYMNPYRIDIKRETGKLPFIYVLLKWVIMIYVIGASVFLLDKLYYLIFRHNARSFEWLAFLINLLLVVILVLRLLKLNEVRYLVVSDQEIKCRKNFPWASRISWNHIRQVQCGYSSVRFITKRGRKHRFSLRKTTLDDQTKLYETLEHIAKSHKVEFLRPL